jgi:hypothetical protein
MYKHSAIQHFLFNIGVKFNKVQMKFKGYLLTFSFLWVEGMAIFPFIFSRTKKPGKVLLFHETIHLRQQLEMGLLPFYIWYFLEYLVRLIQYRNHYLAYMNISFEREAYANEREFEYLVNRKFWAFLRYL